MLLFNQSNHSESPSRVFIHISACYLLPSPYRNQLPVNTRVSGHRSIKGTSSSSLSTNRYETYWYASQMESDRKSWISQGCRVIALGLDEAQQLVYAHPSHSTCSSFFCIIHWFEIWRWGARGVRWIHHANLFHMAKVCPGIYHSIQSKGTPAVWWLYF